MRKNACTTETSEVNKLKAREALNVQRKAEFFVSFILTVSLVKTTGMLSKYPIYFTRSRLDTCKIRIV